MTEQNKTNLEREVRELRLVLRDLAAMATQDLNSPNLGASIRQIEVVARRALGENWQPPNPLDLIHEDEELYHFVRGVLQKAHQEQQRRYAVAFNAWVEEQELRPKHRTEMDKSGGWNEAISFIAEQFQIGEIYDEPDGQEY